MKMNVFFAIAIVLLNTIYPIIVFPYISRVLSISSLGTYNFYNLFFAYILIFTNFGISLYGSKEIGRLKNNAVAKSKLVSELLLINLINTIVVFLFFVLPWLYTIEETDRVIGVLFAVTLFSSTVSVEWYFVGTENQRFIFYRSLIIKTLSLLAVFLLVNDSNSLIYYVIVVVVTQVVNSIVNFLSLIKSVKISVKGLEVKRHYKFLLSIFAVEVCFRYYGMGDIALVEKLVNREQLGLLTFALSIYNIVASFLKIIATTFLPRAAFYLQENDNVNFNNLLSKSFMLVFLLGLPACLGMYFLADEVVAILGGAKYNLAAGLLRSFVPMVMLSAIVNIIVFQYFYPMHRTNLIVCVYLISICINIILNLQLETYLSLYSFVISSLISHIFILLYFLIKEKCWSLFDRGILKYLISFTIAFFTIYGLVYFVGDNTYKVLLSCLVGILLYLMIVYLLKDSLFYSFFKKKLRYENS